MKKITLEAYQLAKYIHDWICVHATSIQSNSPHTIRRYKVTLSLFVEFLEKEKKINPSSLAGECFSRKYVEEWILWLKNKRNCSGETCNIRLAAIGVFLKYLAGKNIAYLNMYQDIIMIPRQKVIKKKVTGMSKEAMKILMSIPNVSTKQDREI